MIESVSENTFGTVPVFFDFNGFYLIRTVSDEINPYESYYNDSKQFVYPVKIFEMRGFEPEAPGFEAGEHCFDLPSSGIDSQSIFRLVEGYDNKQLSGRKFHAAHEDFRFSYFPESFENKAFSDFQITEKRRDSCINSSGICNLLIFSDSDDNIDK